MSTPNATAAPAAVTPTATLPRPRALVVFLENVGHIAGLTLPTWVMRLIDFATEEYAKLMLRLVGAHRHYQRVVILEDRQATGPDLTRTLTETSRTHRVDLLLLVHGLAHQLIGDRGQVSVGAETFGPLLAQVKQDPDLLDLHMVYGVNCYGSSLAPTWTALGAQVCNGAVGVNWLPEPSLSLFLWWWLRGHAYSQALTRSHLAANRLARLIWRPDAAGRPHPKLAGSRQVIYGRQDATIDGCAKSTPHSPYPTPSLGQADG